MVAAKKQAEESKSDLLLEFTGSDWCGPCIKLNKEVFALEPFKAGVKGKFVCVELDFPNDKKDLTAETIKQNNELLEEYKIQGYPTILLCDASGRPYANAGQGNSPEAYVKHLDTLRSRKTQRDEAFATAYKSEGPAQAKALLAALEAMELGDEIIVHFYSEIFKQIKAADPQDEIGYFRDKKSKAQLDAAEEAITAPFRAALEVGNRLVRREEYHRFFEYIHTLRKDDKFNAENKGFFGLLHNMTLEKIIKQATDERVIELVDARRFLEEAKVISADDQAIRDDVEKYIKKFEEAKANLPAPVDLGDKGSKARFDAANAVIDRLRNKEDSRSAIVAVSNSIKEGGFNDEHRGHLEFLYEIIIDGVVGLDNARQLLEEAKAIAPNAKTLKNVEAAIEFLDKDKAKTLIK